MFGKKAKVFRQRLGIFLERDRSVLFVGNIASYRTFMHVIIWIDSYFPRLRIVLAGDRETISWLEGQNLSYHLHLLPFSINWTAKKFLRSVGPRCVVWLDGESAASTLQTLQTMARRGGYPTVRLKRSDRPALAHQGTEPSVVDARPYDEILYVGETDQDLSELPIAGVLRRILALEYRSLRSRSRVSFWGSVLALARNPRWRPFLRWRYWRLNDSSEFGEALGAPKVVMCLGNGPSSEDPSLMDMKKDALFRVNYSWFERGILVDPDAVFSGSSDAIVRAGRAIAVTQNVQSEVRVIRLRAFTFGQARFARADELAPSLYGYDWQDVWPTNGAAMIAVATAMRPERLIVAGMDLFQDARGAYPGDVGTPNTYSPKHDVDLEKEFILGCLERFDGELVIVGEVLRRAWDAHLRGRETMEKASTSL